MKLNKIHFVEKFVLVTFPFAVVVGCTTAANQETKANSSNDGFSAQEYGIEQEAGQFSAHSELTGDPAGPESVSIANFTNFENNDLHGDNMKIQASSPGNETGENHPVKVPPSSAVVDGNSHTTSHPQNNVQHFTKPHPKMVLEDMPPSKDIIYFKANKCEVAQTDLSVLERHAQYLKNHPNTILYVDGFADNRGSASKNYQLSKKRAQLVAQWLIRYGAPYSRIKEHGYGESFPLTSEHRWDENRRVELEYTNLGNTDDLFVKLD